MRQQLETVIAETEKAAVDIASQLQAIDEELTAAVTAEKSGGGGAKVELF